MSTNTSTSAGGGIGFCGLLAIAFIVLKLTNFISGLGGGFCHRYGFLPLLDSESSLST